MFIGGILVLFIYVTSLASNEIFNLSLKLTLIIVIIILFLIFIVLIIDNSIFSFNYNNEYIIINLINYIKEGNQYINKLYNFPTNCITLILINYLFFTLIVTVKITDFFGGPLRNLN